MIALWSVPFILAATLFTGCGYPGNFGPMPGRGLMAHGYGGGFMWLILVILVAVIVYLMLRAKPGRTSGEGRTETPLQILEKRYAQGEITREQFDDMKKDLSK